MYTPPSMYSLSPHRERQKDIPPLPSLLSLCIVKWGSTPGAPNVDTGRRRWTCPPFLPSDMCRRIIFALGILACGICSIGTWITMGGAMAVFKRPEPQWASVIAVICLDSVWLHLLDIILYTTKIKGYRIIGAGMIICGSVLNMIIWGDPMLVCLTITGGLLSGVSAISAQLSEGLSLPSEIAMRAFSMLSGGTAILLIITLSQYRDVLRAISTVYILLPLGCGLMLSVCILTINKVLQTSYGKVHTALSYIPTILVLIITCVMAQTYPSISHLTCLSLMIGGAVFMQI
eukprot:GHVO01006677.1.p1 GENE.GHVO01006677.1~~GHVO01006677.1.p1  ORF type:complete len:289 (+),score=49.93 GHVO01006677.1:639-1505(+)